MIMESIHEGYNEGNCMPVCGFSRMHNCKMSTVFEDQQNRIYYEHIQNEMRLKNLANSDPSIYRDVYSPNKAFSPQPRLHAYDYQLYDEPKYSPVGEHVYDSLWTDYSYARPKEANPNYFYDNDYVYSQHLKDLSNRNSTRFRSKSNDRKQRRLQQNYDCNIWDNNVQMNGRTSPRTFRNPNLSAPSCKTNQYDVHNNYDFNPSVTFSALSMKDIHQTNLNRELWQQSQLGSRDTYQSPQALSPSSPLDSGLSSQSVASSPSLEAEPMHVRRIPECGSPVLLATLQNNQCSCSANSCPDSNVLSPPIRSDSGRSSPWTQSAVSRLNALTEFDSTYIQNGTSSFGDSVSLPTHDVDQRRFSMSGIYINPCERNYGHTTPKNLSVENGVIKAVQRKHLPDKLSACDYEYIYDKTSHTFLSKVSDKKFRAQKCYGFKHSENGIEPTVKNKEYNAGILNQEQYEKNSASLSSAGHKSNDESRKPRKEFTKNSEKAINELEEMYNKLNLQDYDLLDRAERRDLPTQHQIGRPATKSYGLTRSKSDSFYEILGPTYCNPYKKPTRAPPLRRSGIPDLIADDMAMRKLQKSASKPLQKNENISSYMLHSSHFTPSIPIPNQILITNRPDVEYDDFSFRRYFHLSSGKCNDPQPPFGIPLNPNPPQSIFSDYLHVVPSCIPPPLCHPRGNPDLVRDDLAFRSLRKDNPERAMYDSYSLFYRKVR